MTSKLTARNRIIDYCEFSGRRLNAAVRMAVAQVSRL